MTKAGQTDVAMRHLSNRTLFALMLLLGLYFPSSVGGDLSVSLYRASFAVSVIVLVILALRVGVDEYILLWFSGPIVIWLGLCTLPALFQLSVLTVSPLAIFCPLAFLLSVQVGKLRCGNLTRVLIVVSIANVCLGIAMLTVGSVANFMAAHYNDFIDGLVGDMIAANKPVLTFATHSLAGTFSYLFFWLNFRTYQKTGNRLHLALAILQIAICIALMSITSIGFAVLAIAELAWNFRWSSALSAIAAYFLIPTSLKETIGTLFLSDIWFREGGGFRARYVGTGTLASAFAYIQHHPFSPIGLMFSHNLFDEGAQTDSGPLLYFLRGSFILVFLIYAGLFLFLRRNLRDRWECYRLFFVILVAEVGFSVITYSRTYLLLPAFVIYLNSLPAASFVRAAKLESVPLPDRAGTVPQLQT
ncbi:MAG TPA: hypothetical protein VMI32_11820 [Candidatus Solibacter sp.]|nr:hypothetical protein [Candidatus Solibacter sp.]